MISNCLNADFLQVDYHLIGFFFWASMIFRPDIFLKRTSSVVSDKSKIVVVNWVNDIVSELLILSILFIQCYNMAL